MSRRNFTWTKKQLDKLNKVIEILQELEKYKPLTLRQVYYQLVGKGFIENKVSEYTMLSGLLKHARIDGYVSWNDIEDRVRAFHDLRGYNDKQEFIDIEINNFLNGYARDLLQTQGNHIEVWLEKDALSSIFTKITSKYTVPVGVCRGFSSVSFLNDLRDRADYYDKLNKNIVMLYFGDFDPSGIEMLEAMKITLQNEMDVNNIEFKRIALQKEDITKYNLPNDPTALKKTDTRAKKFLKEYGNYAVELDALRPDVLEEKIKTAIEKELDVTAFNLEVKHYRTDIDKLNKIKTKVENFIREL